MHTYSIQIAMAAETLLGGYQEQVRKATKMYPHLKAIEERNALQQERTQTEAGLSRLWKKSVNWISNRIARFTSRRLGYQNR